MLARFIVFCYTQKGHVKHRLSLLVCC